MNIKLLISIIFLIVWSSTFIIPLLMNKDKEDSDIYSILKTLQWLLPVLLIIIIIIILVSGGVSLFKEVKAGGPARPGRR